MPLKFKIYSITNYSYDKVFSLVYSNSLIRTAINFQYGKSWIFMYMHCILFLDPLAVLLLHHFKTKQIITLPYRSFVWIPALMYWFQTHHTEVEEHADQSHWSLHKRKWHHGSLQSHLVGGVFLTSSTTLSVVMLARS